MSNNERYSNKQAPQRYFDRRPEIVKIFNDLESYLNFCRIELLPYNSADLYNKNSKIWQLYEREQRYKKNPSSDRRNHNNRQGHRVNKPRSH